MKPLFAYPTLAHRRRETPPSFSDHKRYKPYLRREYAGWCVYCRFPDGQGGTESFHVEHYQPRSRGGEETNYANLLYSCARCNLFKGSYWPTSSEARDKRVVLHPDQNALADHIRFVEELVDPRTAEARFTAELLKLNNPNRVRERRTLLGIYRAFLKNYNAELDSLSALNKALVSEARGARRQELEDLRAEIESELSDKYRLMVDHFGVDL